MSEFNFKKKYGQNFLNNEDIIDKIVSSIEPNQNDLIIEIGPGSGALTRKLKSYNATLLAFEIDGETRQYLDKLENKKTHIIYEDFMTADVPKILSDYSYDKLYIIGNLPYYITTAIIDRIINLELNPEQITIMVQKEVADRFLAKPRTKDYGYMTLILNYWFDLVRVVEAPKKYFTPVPKVDSTVLKLVKNPIEQIDYPKFVKLLKDSFQFKRKTINNNLKGYDKDKVASILEKHGYTLSNRAEEIDLETYIDLVKNI